MCKLESLVSPLCIHYRCIELLLNARIIGEVIWVFMHVGLSHKILISIDAAVRMGRFVMLRL